MSSGSEQRYLPFGQVRSDIGPIVQTDFGYTGQRNLGNMGLMDYKARFYDPTLGRFIQPDTIIPSFANPQGLNRYSYVENSPILLADPSGNFGKCNAKMSGYLCKVRQNKAHQLEQQWAQQAAQKKAQLIALQMTQQAQMDAYADMMLGHAGGQSSSTQIRGVGIVGSGGHDESLFEMIAGNRYTPFAFAVAQEIAAGGQDLGALIIASGTAEANPVVALAGAAIYNGSFYAGRVASLLGTADTIYQYSKHLNGVNGTDVYVSIATTIVGIDMRAAPAASTANLMYNAYRLYGGTVPDYPFPPKLNR